MRQSAIGNTWRGHGRADVGGALPISTADPVVAVVALPVVNTALREAEAGRPQRGGPRGTPPGAAGSVCLLWRAGHRVATGWSAENYVLTGRTLVMPLRRIAGDADLALCRGRDKDAGLLRSFHAGWCCAYRAGGRRRAGTSERNLETMQRVCQATRKGTDVMIIYIHAGRC
jgi:hypothetical protein